MTAEKKESFQWLRLATPLLLVTIGWMVNSLDGKIDTTKRDLTASLGGVATDLKETNAMVFKHLTNDEMHTPRSIAVLKPEFTIYQAMRDQQVRDQKSQLDRIESLVERHVEKSSKG